MSIGLEPILEWNMTAQEAKAFKVCLLWLRNAREFFPENEVGRIPKKGDPRKSSIVRYAWKMVRETAGYGLKDEEVSLYVRAQCEMLRSIQLGGRHVRVGPNCLTGDKAWVRWKMWQREHARSYERQQHATSSEVKTPTYKLTQELEKSRDFLEKKFGHLPTLNDIAIASCNGDIARWAGLYSISPFYILLSPFCYEAFQGRKIQEVIPSVDFNIYKKDIDTTAIEEFKKIFPHEVY